MENMVDIVAKALPPEYKQCGKDLVMPKTENIPRSTSESLKLRPGGFITVPKPEPSNLTSTHSMTKASTRRRLAIGTYLRVK